MALGLLREMQPGGRALTTRLLHTTWRRDAITQESLLSLGSSLRFNGYRSDRKQTIRLNHVVVNPEVDQYNPDDPRYGVNRWTRRGHESSRRGDHGLRRFPEQGGATIARRAPQARRILAGRQLPSVGQIYLLDNPLLKEPLKREHIKPRLLGHWGTSPGLNMLCVHFNRVIKRDDLNMIYIIEKLIDHGQYIARYGDDIPAISGWK